MMKKKKKKRRKSVFALWAILSMEPSSQWASQPTACSENETVTHAKRKFQFIAYFYAWHELNWNLICLNTLLVSNVCMMKRLQWKREKENEILQLLLIYSLLNCRFHLLPSLCVFLSFCLSLSRSFSQIACTLCRFDIAYTQLCFQNEYKYISFQCLHISFDRCFVWMISHKLWFRSTSHTIIMFIFCGIHRQIILAISWRSKFTKTFYIPHEE